MVKFVSSKIVPDKFAGDGSPIYLDFEDRAVSKERALSLVTAKLRTKELAISREGTLIAGAEAARLREERKQREDEEGRRIAEAERKRHEEEQRKIIEAQKTAEQKRIDEAKRKAEEARKSEAQKKAEAEARKIAEAKELIPISVGKEITLTTSQALNQIKLESDKSKKELNSFLESASSNFRSNFDTLTNNLNSAIKSRKDTFFTFTDEKGKKQTMDRESIILKLRQELKNNKGNFDSAKISINTQLTNLGNQLKENISSAKKAIKITSESGFLTFSIPTSVIESKVEDKKRIQFKVNVFLTSYAKRQEAIIKKDTEKFAAGKIRLKDPTLGVEEGFKLLGTVIKSGINVAGAKVADTIIGKKTVRSGVSKGIEDIVNISKIVITNIKKGFGITKTKANEWKKIIDDTSKIIEKAQKVTGTPIGIQQINTFKKRLNELKKNIDKLAITPTGEKIIVNIRKQLRKDKSFMLLSKSKSFVGLLTKELTGKELTAFQFAKEVDRAIKKAPANVLKKVITTAFPKTDFSKVAPSTIKKNLSIFLEAKTKKGKAAATAFLNRKTKSAIETGGIVGFTERAFIGTARDILELPQTVRELKKLGVEVSKMSKPERKLFLAVLAAEIPKATLKDLSTPEGLGSFVIGGFIAGKLVSTIGRAVSRAVKSTKLAKAVKFKIGKRGLLKEAAPEFIRIEGKLAQAYGKKGLPANLRDRNILAIMAGVGNRGISGRLKDFQVSALIRTFMKNNFKRSIRIKNADILVEGLIKSKPLLKGVRLSKNFTKKTKNQIDDLIEHASRITLKQKSAILDIKFTKTPVGQALSLNKKITEKLVGKRTEIKEFFSQKQLEDIVFIHKNIMKRKLTKNQLLFELESSIKNLKGVRRISAKQIEFLQDILAGRKIRTKDLARTKSFIIGEMSAKRKIQLTKNIKAQLKDVSDKVLIQKLIASEKRVFREIEKSFDNILGAKQKEFAKLTKNQLDIFEQLADNKQTLYIMLRKLEPKTSPSKTLKTVAKLKHIDDEILRVRRSPTFKATKKPTIKEAVVRSDAQGNLITDITISKKGKIISDIISPAERRATEIIKKGVVKKGKAPSLAEVLRKEKNLVKKLTDFDEPKISVKQQKINQINRRLDTLKARRSLTPDIQKEILKLEKQLKPSEITSKPLTELLKKEAIKDKELIKQLTKTTKVDEKQALINQINRRLDTLKGKRSLFDDDIKEIIALEKQLKPSEITSKPLTELLKKEAIKDKELIKQLTISKVDEKRALINQINRKLDFLKDRKSITSDIARDIKVLESAKKSGSLARLRSATKVKVKPKKKVEVSDFISAPSDGIVYDYVESAMPATALVEARGLVIPFVPLPRLGVSESRVQQKYPISNLARVMLKNPKVEIINVKKGFRSVVTLKPTVSIDKIKKKFDITPVIIPISVQESDSKLRDKLKPKPLVKEKVTPALKKKITPAVAEEVAVKPIVKFKIDNKTSNILKKKLKISEKQALITKTAIPIIEEERRIPPPRLGEFARYRKKLKIGFRRKPKKKKTVKVIKKIKIVKKFKYTPSITALAFGLTAKKITGKKKKTFSGLEIRLIRRNEKKLISKAISREDKILRLRLIKAERKAKAQKIRTRF